MRRSGDRRQWVLLVWIMYVPGGRAPTESTQVESGFELLVRVPWTKSHTQTSPKVKEVTARKTAAAQDRESGAGAAPQLADESGTA
jgi:hypothetical protein